MQIVVVTKAPTDAGNMALGGMNLFVDTDEPDPTYEGTLTKLEPFVEWLQKALPKGRAISLILQLREPVFYVGEILFLDESTGREIVGVGRRKPGKWHVEVETVESIEDAIKLSQQVSEQHHTEAREADNTSEEDA